MSNPHDHDHAHGHDHGHDHAHDHVGAAGGTVDPEQAQLGPSYDGTVVLDIGGDIGALILHTGPDLLLAEIEISPAGDLDAKRRHVAVRERRGPSGTRYAAIYPSVREGEYTVWGLDGRAADTVRVDGGRVTELDWR